MPYTKGASNATGPYIVGGTQTYQQANNAEYQYDEATQSLGPDALSGSIISNGGGAVKDGTIASQLDFSGATAYLKQADGTFRRWVFSSANFSTTGNPSTTMYLDLQPDHTTSWATTHSAQANYTSVCSVTTDGSANISAVTDLRTIVFNAFGGVGPAVGAFIQLAGLYPMLFSSTSPAGNWRTFYTNALPTSGMVKYDLAVIRPFA